MKIWQNCLVEILYYSNDSAGENEPCIVKISSDEILVEYEDHDKSIVQYRGRNSGDGHFKLTSAQVNGEATLHMFKDSSELEGSWREDQQRGMWRIRLA